MRSVPLAKINIYNVYSSGIFKYFSLLFCVGRQTTTHLSLSFYIKSKAESVRSLSLSLFLRAHLIILYMKRIVIFINTCPFSLAPAICFFSYHRKQKRISRRLAHLFGLVSRLATSRRTAPGRRFSLSACTRVSRRTFSWPETFSWQQPERMKSFSLSSSPRWRRRRRGTRRTTPRRRGSLSWIKIPS